VSAPRVEDWGATSRGERALLFTLEGDGIRARVSNFGATLVSLEIADRKGDFVDVVLGFDTLAEYESPKNPYIGGIIGRVANRIAGANFELDGRRHVLEANAGRHHLHGGSRGFDRVAWKASPGDRASGLTLRRQSPQAEQGYPGNLDVSVTYALGPARRLEISYVAESDAPTPVNLTQHSYFNLAGGGTILDHVLEVPAARFVVVDDELIPTGELRDVEQTEFDFRTPRRVGERGSGYDICYALGESAWKSKPVFACRLTEPRSGRVLEVEAMQPGLQLYTGQHLSDLQGRLGRPIPRYGGLCLESQHFPDSVHHESFPATVLRPGDKYRTLTSWRFSDA